MRLEARFRREGSILQGTARASCEGFFIELMLESDAEPERVKELVRLAHDTCFTEAALANPVPVEKSAVLNGRRLD